MTRTLLAVLILVLGLVLGSLLSTVAVAEEPSVTSASDASAPVAPSHARLKELIKKDKDVKLDQEAGGDHWRISTPRGAVHVWRPPGFDPASAGIVVYVHGYQVSVDDAWRDYHLARQFKQSHQNAIFIVPDAPGGNDDEVNWPALSELFKTVRSRTHTPLPDGDVVVFGHSGAFRTIAAWTDNRRMADVILLDALYGEQDKFTAWLETAKGHEYHTMIVVASTTVDRASDFVQGFKDVIRRDDFPDSYAGFTRNQKRARLLFIKSQVGHMELVTDEKVIPMLLRLTPLKLLTE